MPKQQNISISETPIGDLQEADYNPRTIDKKQFSGLVESIKTFGFAEPIVANQRETGELVIVGGHMRVRAAKQLGYKTVPTVKLNLSQSEEKKLNVLLNSQEISGEYDQIKLSQLLEELKLEEDYTALRLDALEPLDLSAGRPEDQRRFGTEESEEAYNNSTIGQLILVYQNAEYIEIMEIVEALISDLQAKGKNVSTPADLFKYLIMEQTNADANP